MVITIYPSIKNKKYIFKGGYDDESIVYVSSIVIYNSLYQNSSFIIHYSLFIIHYSLFIIH